MKRAVGSWMGGLFAFFLLASVLVGPLQSAPAKAAAATAPEFGVQFHATWSDYSDAERIEVLDKMAAAGVKWVRIDIGWTSLQEDSRTQWTKYHLDRLEKVVDAARARGIQVLGTLWLTPAWANGGAGSKMPPSNPADYAAAATYVANYFKGRVAAWEVWNEPNHSSFYKGTINQYVGLLKAAYPAFKLGDPSAEVLLGGPSYNDTSWLRKVYEAGAQGSFDVMSTHPYQGFADAPPETPDDGSQYTMAHVSKVYELMQEFGDGNKKIWFTEFGWSSHDNWPGVDNWERGVTLKQQADFAVRTLEYLKAKHPYVTKVFWYNERNNDSGDIQYDNYGILNRDLSPKPVYNALKAYLTGDTPVVDPTPAPTPTTSVPDPLPSPTPTVPEIPAEVEEVVLVDGDFESGVDDWRASGSLRRVTDSRVGDFAVKVSGPRRDKRLVSAPVSDADAESFRLEGFLRGATGGQRIKVVVEEIVGTSVVGGSSRTLTIGRSWKSIPTVSYMPSATGSEIRVQVKALTKAKFFVADGLRLTSLR